MGPVHRTVLLCAFTALLLACASTAAFTAKATDDAISVVFSFDPPKQEYCPDENFTINFTVTNVLPPGEYVYDVKVTNVSVHFSWMAPNEYCWCDVSNESSWLDSDGLATETYELDLCVPADAASTTYSYCFKVAYVLSSEWGELGPSYWGVGDTYRDFVVTTEADAGIEGGSVDLAPYLVFIAVVLSIGAMAAVAYQRYAGRGSAGMSGMGAYANGEVFPAIGPTPGEHFPVEVGFLYLVKEKRPRTAFDMFNEAVRHGAKGMLVAREHPNRLRHSHDFEAEKILWLTRRTGVDHIDPTELSLLNLKITKFVEGTDQAVVLIEGLEYTITQNDFESVLRFVNHLHDFVLIHDCAVIMVIDPRVLTTRQLALLERAAKIIEPYEGVEQPSDEGEDGGAV